MRKRIIEAILFGSLAAAIAWTYWPTLEILAKHWANDPRYAHGALVPFFAWYLWKSRQVRARSGLRRPSWWGIAPIVGAAAVRFVGVRTANDWLDAVSLLFILVGLTLLNGGWPLLRRAWPAIAFLLFMIPLPYRIEVALSVPLQELASSVSAFSLQSIGIPALADGTSIRLLESESSLEVGRACSGLSMLVLFFALATGVAFAADRRRWDRLTIVLSAVPIALLANVARITLTGLLHERAGNQLSGMFAHDLSGWLMIPLALGMLWCEIGILSRLLIDAPLGDPGPVPLLVSSSMAPNLSTNESVVH